MEILPLRRDLMRYLASHRLAKKFEKQATLFRVDINYPSLQTELLEPRHVRLFSFRIDRKYRAIFVFVAEDTVEIVDINNHYQ